MRVSGNIQQKNERGFFGNQKVLILYGREVAMGDDIFKPVQKKNRDDWKILPKNVPKRSPKGFQKDPPKRVPILPR